MKHILIYLSLFYCQSILNAQVVINELDCDTPGIDNMEFLELLSDEPNFSLNGYVIVFFNGSDNGGNSSYFTIDLDGFQTDVNGLFLIGSIGVSPVPQYLIPENVIQNGADAVAIYQASDFNFPDETLATTNNLIDVLMYDTSDGDDIDMLDIFRMHPNFINLQQINEGSSNNTNSIQRNMDGTYTSKAPTPRRLNDGGGIDLNGIRIDLNQNQYSEGEEMEIVITMEEDVLMDTDLDIALNNSFFNGADYSGQTSLTIPAGERSVMTTIELVDDNINEGDEVAIIRFINLSDQLLALNNNVMIRIVDNDFVVASYGIPTSPTYGLVAGTQSTDYYNTIDGLSGIGLRSAIQNIVAEESVRAHSYADIVEILMEADQNPANSNEVWLVYSEEGRPKLDFQFTADNNGKWNREHTFPRSRGGYRSIEEDEVADGINIFWPSNADSLRHGNSDGHGLRAADGRENGQRNNQHYGEYNGPMGNLGSFKGDVARSVLFMAIRYNDLEVVNGFPETQGQLGDLSTILEWHRADPPDDFEMNRNNVIYRWQNNRNPFIDQPELVEYIWGDRIGDIWNQPVNNENVEELKLHLYPNPLSGELNIIGLQHKANVEIYASNGHKIKSLELSDDKIIDLGLEPGIYWIRIKSAGKLKTSKLIVLKN